MKIAIFQTNEFEKKYLKKKLFKHKLYFFDEPIQEVNLKKFRDVDVISVFIYSKIDSEMIKNLKKVKLIVTRSTGFDHIDVKTAIDKGIQIANVPFYGENTVAEHTFALILNLSRKVHKSYIRTREEDYSIEGLEGFDLKDKTLGVIGVGHIGLNVIKIAKGFGMHVKAFDLNKDKFISDILHFEYSELDELLKTSDIISLHMPYNLHTHHFINKKKLMMCKKGVIIINTARGGLIDTKSLYECLKNRHIGGAGLDVIEGEELIDNEEEILENKTLKKKISEVFRDKEIFKMDNVIFTPHNAFNSSEAKRRILDSVIENILEFDLNKKAKYLVK